MRQVEDLQSQSGQSTAAASVMSASASSYRAPSSVQRVEMVQQATLCTPPGCRETRIFDISEIECDIDDLNDFSFPSVMMVRAGPQEFSMDSTDADGKWDAWSPTALDSDLVADDAGEASHVEVSVNVTETGASCQPRIDVVVDSGADVSVARPFVAVVRLLAEPVS